MFAKSIQYYDDIYSFKDYREEADRVAALIRNEHPSAKAILDVACGTGEHAKLLSSYFSVDGLDVEPEFVELSKTKVPNGSFWVADMRSFNLEKRYDVVQCLFSSIGYLTQKEDVVEALRAFQRHLAPGGIIVVEPWFTPDSWKVGVPWMTTVDRPDLKICRMNVSEREGTLSKLRFHYLIARREGVEHFEEHHDLALYSVEEMLGFFRAANLVVKHDAEGIFGRGIYVAKQRA